jgi:hypothetical protein
VQLILSEADAVMRVRPNLVIASQQLRLVLANAGIVDRIPCGNANPSAGQNISGIRVVTTDTLMRDDAGQQRLARETLRFAASLRSAA